MTEELIKTETDIEEILLNQYLARYDDLYSQEAMLRANVLGINY